MAKLPALVSVITEFDGRERKAVAHIARTIRERGYITTGKRGGGADEKTPHEAANLLIALNGADTPKGGPLAIDRFRSLQQSFRGTSKDIHEHLAGYEDFPKPIRDVMDVHTFGEAFDALIEGVPDLVASLRQYYHESHDDKKPEVLDRHFYSMLRLGFFGVLVTFQRYAAKIELYSMHGHERRVEFEADFIQDMDRTESGFYGKEWPDRRISVNIGTPTLIAVWQVLNPGISLPGIPDRAPVSDVDDAADDE